MFHLIIFLFVVLQTSGDGAQGAEQGHERPGEQHEAGAEVQQHHRRGRLQEVRYCKSHPYQ